MESGSDLTPGKIIFHRPVFYPAIQRDTAFPLVIVAEEKTQRRPTTFAIKIERF
jgi:hypothetical protein